MRKQDLIKKATDSAVNAFKSDCKNGFFSEDFITDYLEVYFSAQDLSLDDDISVRCIKKAIKRAGANSFESEITGCDYVDTLSITDNMKITKMIDDSQDTYNEVTS